MVNYATAGGLITKERLTVNPVSLQAHHFEMPSPSKFSHRM